MLILTIGNVLLRPHSVRRLQSTRRRRILQWRHRDSSSSGNPSYGLSFRPRRRQNGNRKYHRPGKMKNRANFRVPVSVVVERKREDDLMKSLIDGSCSCFYKEQGYDPGVLRNKGFVCSSGNGKPKRTAVCGWSFSSKPFHPRPISQDMVMPNARNSGIASRPFCNWRWRQRSAPARSSCKQVV